MLSPYNLDDLRFKLRRDTAAEWTRKNPVLLDGEPGYEKDSQKLKIGDGIRAWVVLPYLISEGGGPVVVGPGSSDAAIAAHVASLTPHPVYDDGPDLLLLYQNAKV